jgi:hypothetical protein
MRIRVCFTSRTATGNECFDLKTVIAVMDVVELPRDQGE